MAAFSPTTLRSDCSILNKYFGRLLAMINTGRSIRPPSGNGGGSKTKESGSSPLENNEIKILLSSNGQNDVNNIVLMTPLRWYVHNYWPYMYWSCNGLRGKLRLGR